MRYNNRKKYINDSEQMADLFDNRGVDSIEYYETPILKYPTDRELARLVNKPHIWVLGDRLYKLAAEYYSDPELWWIIAWYNSKPTEGHILVGEIINIPTPLGKVLQFLGY